jgi:hypothetical protein
MTQTQNNRCFFSWEEEILLSILVKILKDIEKKTSSP